ncbi:MAG: dehydrogenase [Gemmataceae bacterium]|nr:dehydrogenase [Gemmataceae bacterium]
MSGGRFFSRVGLSLVPPAALVAVLSALVAAVPGSPGAGTARAQVTPPAPLALQKGDHVCIIGNALAERMQHDGWLEAYLHARFPDHDLTIRNLGFSGDEVGGYATPADAHKRLRSHDFGTADQWLGGSAPVPNPGAVADKEAVKPNRFEQVGTNADVIFAFFGYNESYAGGAGLPKFKDELSSFIKHTLAQKYNGKSAPRLVLFSPIAFENHHSPNLPAGDEQNKNLELYTTAMAEVATASGVSYVDLFHPTQALYLLAKRGSPLTINGVHLTPDGDRHLAALIDHQLFAPAQAAPPAEPKTLAPVRAAVLDKNRLWYQRYRATDGYSTFGGRAWLKFVNGQTNYEVVQRELEVIDQLVLNRDKVIWAAAKGQVVKPDDSNLPPFVPVTTNKPGKGPGGTHLFLSGEDAIKAMTVAKGMKVTLFADETMFPELAKPVQMAWDPQGRLWVAVWPAYPHWKPTEPMNDKLLVFEDTDGDGKADKMTVFADGLHNPTGFEFYNGGVIVAQAPDLVFLKDTDGDGKADVRERIVHGLDTADTHHTANSFVLDPGGALYFQEGTFHRSQVEDAYGPPKRVADGAVFRYEPRTQKFDVYVTFGFANPHGHVFDRWGQDVVVDGTGANPFHGPLFSSHMDYPQKHGRPPQVYQQRTRPCPGMEFLSSKHFPEEFDGDLLVANVIGFQGILRYKMLDVGASLGAQELEPMVSSTDPNFRPSDLKVGPDGAIYFIDWQNPIIGHMQHNLRDPSRDREHGRIYKVTYEGRALSTSPKIAGEPIEKLLDLLKHPEDRVRYRVKIELGGRKTEDVREALTKWCNKLDSNDPDCGHQILEAMWVAQYHNIAGLQVVENKSLGVPPTLTLFGKSLNHKDFRVRAAVIRVLCYQRDQIPRALEFLKNAAADPHPRVRLMAVWAASFFTVPEAAEVVFVAQDQPTDVYLTHMVGETMKTLGPIVSKAVAEKRTIRFTTPAGARYFLKAVPTDDLVTMRRTREVNTELLFRPGVRDEVRREAVAGLAKEDQKADLYVLIDAIKTQDESAAAEGVAFDLVRLLTSRPQSELAKARPELQQLATTSKNAVTRQLGFVALVAADGTVEDAWRTGVRSVAALQDLVAAMPLVRDPAQRAALYPKVEALLGGLPPDLAKTVGDVKTVKGRYVRVELPGKQRTLTLAEVEVFSAGKNIALRKKATQSSTAYGGTADRGVDGNKSATFGDGGQTHSQEGTDNPWWEVDLGAEVPVETVVVYNRTDGSLGSRLANFTLRVLDGDRRTVFQSLKNPAPAVKAEFAVGSASPGRVVRHSAMFALTSVRGKEADAFKAIAKFVADDDERTPAVQALLRIPAKDWPTDQARPLLAAVMKYVRGLPVSDRTTPAALDAMQLGDALAGLLPPAEAKQARKELGEIGVRVVRVGTLTDQMLFDRDRLVAQAGKPIEFVFENTDIMPHNFVITVPGALEEVGNAAEAFGTQPGAAEKHYVPPLPGKVLLASKLLQPQTGQQLRFQAPKEPGIYPYVCTYPGHWRRMHGALYVVADLDEYLADPAGYLAKTPLPVKDDLLKFNRPRTEWKLEELAGAVQVMEQHGGRNFANGKQMFTVATCVACHKFGGQGNEFGPDLTKLDPKTVANSTDLLRHVLEPSLKIDDKYATYRLVLDDDSVVTGMIVGEKDGVVQVIENPLASAKPRELKAKAIVERKKGASSIMPKGLLDKLTKDEVLDLLAYVRGGADPKHTLFQGGHDHGHKH